MQITLARADQKEMRIVRHFFLDYFYYMAQYDDHIFINAAGLPVDERANPPDWCTAEECVQINWWIRDDCEIYLVKADERPAGFVFICADKKHLAPEVDYELLDFYITGKYRRLGLGKIAALAAFELHQGNWQVFQLERNTPARKFWQEIINEYTGGQYQNLDDGTQQRFRN